MAQRDTVEVLQTPNFEDLTAQHVPNVKSTIARYVIPQRTAALLTPRAHTLEILLPASETFATTNDANTDETFALGFPLAYDDNPLPFGMKLRWREFDDAGALVQTATEAQITVDQAAGEVTGPKTASVAGYTVVIDYVPRNGLVAVDKVDSSGGQEARSTMLTKSQGVLATTDQAEEGAILTWDRHHALLEDMALEIAVTTAWTPALDNPLATLLIRYQPVTMQELLERARMELKAPQLTKEQLRAAYIAQWK